MSPILRAALFGGVSGHRSVSGLAALSLTSPAAVRSQPTRTLCGTWFKRALVFGALQEIVMDKLPFTPSRLAPAGLIARAAAGGLCGVVVMQAQAAQPARSDESVPADRSALIAGAAAGTAAALATSVLGSRWRRWAAAKAGGDLPGAMAEDLWALGLAAAGTQLNRSARNRSARNRSARNQSGAQPLQQP